MSELSCKKCEGQLTGKPAQGKSHKSQEVSVCIFLDQLKEKNTVFYIALHFCHKKYRNKVAALVHLYSEWTGLFNRIKEPIAIQMRLTWWQEQCSNADLPANFPPEMLILKGYRLDTLLTAIEHEYLYRDSAYSGQSACILFGLIADITENYTYNADAKAYGLYYGLQNNHAINTPPNQPHNKLPFGLRFLRIPIILHNKQHFLTLCRRFIKNFLFAT